MIGTKSEEIIYERVLVNLFTTTFLKKWRYGLSNKLIKLVVGESWDKPFIGKFVAVADEKMGDILSVFAVIGNESRDFDESMPSLADNAESYQWIHRQLR